MRLVEIPPRHGVVRAKEVPWGPDGVGAFAADTLIDRAIWGLWTPEDDWNSMDPDGTAVIDRGWVFDDHEVVLGPHLIERGRVPIPLPLRRLAAGAEKWIASVIDIDSPGILPNPLLPSGGVCLFIGAPEATIDDGEEPGIAALLWAADLPADVDPFTAAVTRVFEPLIAQLLQAAERAGEHEDELAHAVQDLAAAIRSGQQTDRATYRKALRFTAGTVMSICLAIVANKLTPPIDGDFWAGLLETVRDAVDRLNL
jgi:hypothetical protein